MNIAELKITLDDKGTVAVSGPIDPLMLCYGLLELAKDSLRNHAMEKARKVQAPGPSELLTFGRKE